MARVSGMEIFEAVTQRSPDTPVVLITAYAEPGAAMDAIARGAADYLAKPVDVVALAHRPWRERSSDGGCARRTGSCAREAVGKKALIGTSPAMLELYKQLAQVAPSDATVLITGESGAGKELVARTVHERSRRAAGRSGGELRRARRERCSRASSSATSAARSPARTSTRRACSKRPGWDPVPRRGGRRAARCRRSCCGCSRRAKCGASADRPDRRRRARDRRHQSQSRGDVAEGAFAPTCSIG